MKTRSPFFALILLFFLHLMSGCKKNTDKYNHGVGIYPGNPQEDFSPNLIPAGKDYRNIALLKPAYH